MGNIEFLILAIGSIVFFTLLLVTGNTMAIAVRERTGELAVLKAVGYSDRFVLGLVLAESLADRGGRRRRSASGSPAASWRQDLTSGILLDVPVRARPSRPGWRSPLGTGLLAGLLPAVSAMRLSVVDALRRV